MTRRALVPALILLVLATSGCIGNGILPDAGEGGSADTGVETHGGIEFMTSYDAAKQRAIDEGKPLLVYFWAPWCVWCDRYHENVFPDSRVKGAMESYVRVAVNVDESPGLVDRYRVRGPPTLVWVYPESGEELYRFGGYPNPDTVKDPAGKLAEILDAAAGQYHAQ